MRSRNFEKKRLRAEVSLERLLSRSRKRLLLFLNPTTLFFCNIYLFSFAKKEKLIQKKSDQEEEYSRRSRRKKVE
jgi:hypothetical protein